MKAILRGGRTGRQPDRRQGRAGARIRRFLQRSTFAALYGPGARLYDGFTALLFLGEWARWQATVLPLLPNKGSIVEIGSGTGALAAKGVSTRRRWCCLEASGPMIAVSRRRCRSVGALLVRGDARALPFAGASFAGAVATFPTAYILSPATQVELARVVAPSGTLAIVLTGRLAPHGPRRALRCRLLRLFYGGGPTDLAHERILPTVAGFAGTCRWIPTTHGDALVYVGVRAAHYGDVGGDLGAAP